MLTKDTIRKFKSMTISLNFIESCKKNTQERQTRGNTRSFDRTDLDIGPGKMKLKQTIDRLKYFE